MRRFFGFFFSFTPLFAAALGTLPLGCSSKANLVGQGGVCQLATDCQSGLICIPQKDGTSVCSSNLGSVQQLAPTPDAAIPPLPDAGTSSTDGGMTGIPGDAAGPGNLPEAGAGD